MQTEYSLWTRDIEADILPLLRELGIGLVAYAPLGHGFLTGAYRNPQNLADGDFRRSQPRFAEQNIAHNLQLADRIEQLAAEKGITPAQLRGGVGFQQGVDLAVIAVFAENARVDRAHLGGVADEPARGEPGPRWRGRGRGRGGCTR